MSWRSGPFYGVRIVVSASWLLIFALIVLALEALRVFPAEVPTALRWLAAAAVGVLFFMSVVGHELAHAVIARRYDVDVQEVGLSIVGTQGELERRAASPRGDLLIAVSGPLISLLVGGLLLGLALLLPAPRDVGPTAGLVRAVIALVGMANVLLGAVNLLPGAPFDGGRALRALLWARSGDVVTASRTASRAGRLLGYGMIGMGIAWAAFGQTLDGVWLAVLGWFLNQAAQAQQRRLEINRIVEGLSVGDVMEHDYAVIRPSLTLDTLLDQHALGSAARVYPVTEGGRLLGAIEIERVRRLPRQQWPSTRVSEVMTGADRLPRLTVLSTVMEALLLFDRSRAAALPVTDTADRHRLVGMLTRDGLLNVLRARRQRLDAPAASGSGEQPA